MWQVQVKPQWLIGVGEPGADEWVPAVGFYLPSAESSSFETRDAALAVMRVFEHLGTTCYAPQVFQLVEVE